MVKFQEVLKNLNSHQVEYIIIGGYAAVLHGASYATNDVDICYHRTKQNLESIVHVLKPFRPKLRTIDGDVPFLFDTKTLLAGMNFTLSTDLGDIDLLGEVSGVGNYQNMIKNAEPTVVFQEKCFVISLLDLLKTKKAVGRPKDLSLVDQIEALIKAKEKF